MLHVHYVDKEMVDGPLLALLKKFCGESKSNHAWRRLIQGKGLTVNNVTVESEKQALAEFLMNDVAVVRIGKKQFYTFIANK